MNSATSRAVECGDGNFNKETGKESDSSRQLLLKERRRFNKHQTMSYQFRITDRITIKFTLCKPEEIKTRNTNIQNIKMTKERNVSLFHDFWFIDLSLFRRVVFPPAPCLRRITLLQLKWFAQLEKI